MELGTETPVVIKTTDGVLLFWCPGCHQLHGVWTERPNPRTQAVWAWNNDVVRPTVNPSVLLPGVAGLSFRCHSFIRDGCLEFCQDCEHNFAGRRIRMLSEPLHHL